jgi:glucokinase
MSEAQRRPPYYLGIDLGGTAIKSGVVDDEGRPLSSISLPTEAVRGPDVGLRNMAEAARQAVAESGLKWPEIAGVGLGSPGDMDLPAGLLLNPPNLPGWDNLPIRDRLAELLGTPIAFQNDANAAAFGEFWVGAGRDVDSMALYTLGTGIGCGIIDHGRIISGQHSHGSECGHMIIQAIGGREHPPGYFGRLEAYASATALVLRANEALEAGESSSLSAALASGELTAELIDDHSKAGDPLAVRLMKETAYFLAVGAVSLMHTIDPDIIHYGGGMAASGPAFLEDIRAGIKRMAFPVPAAKTRVEYALLGTDAGFIGAAGWARELRRTAG